VWQVQENQQQLTTGSLEQDAKIFAAYRWVVQVAAAMTLGWIIC